MTFYHRSTFALLLLSACNAPSSHAQKLGDVKPLQLGRDVLSTLR